FWPIGFVPCVTPSNDCTGQCSRIPRHGKRVRPTTPVVPLLSALDATHRRLAQGIHLRTACTLTKARLSRHSTRTSRRHDHSVPLDLRRLEQGAEDPVCDAVVRGTRVRRGVRLAHFADRRSCAHPHP